MGFLSALFGGGKQKAGENEKFLKAVGESQLAVAQTFDPAHKAVLREAQTDQSNRIRGRAAGGVWQGLSRDAGATRMALGDATKQAMYEGLATSAVGGALRGGSKSGLALHDDLIQAGATSRLANAQVSGRSARDEAQQVHQEQAQKVSLANEWAGQVRGAIMGTAALAGGEYMDGKRLGAAPPKGLNYKMVEQQNPFFRAGFNKSFGGGP